MTQNGKPLEQKIIHASCVLIQNCGVLIVGPSGSGKSSLALRLIGLGGELIADDLTILSNHKTGIIATCPETIQGRIEARGVGILRLSAKTNAGISLVIDMESAATERIPKAETYSLFGIDLPLIRAAPLDAFPEAVYYSIVGNLERE